MRINDVIWILPVLLGSTAADAVALNARAASAQVSRISHIWANSGEDKVTRDELRASRNAASVRNSVWNGEQIELSAARNEVVSFNLVLEAGEHDADDVQVTLDALSGPNDAKIAARPADVGADLFNFVGCNIELFYVRYLPIKGISILAYDHYDERHIPRRLRRPYLADGRGYGSWENRPDHDKLYPEIAVPLELHATFGIRAGTNQSIWADVYVPKSSPPGIYSGVVVVREQGHVTREMPVRLRVFDFTLPDLPTARTMVYMSRANVNRRYLGEPYPHDTADVQLVRKSSEILDRHFQLAHRHKLSLIDDYTPVEQMESTWHSRLSGELFTPLRGYDGIGVGVGNNVYCIGTYGSWPWKTGGEPDMQANSDAWVRWFEAHKFSTPTDYFLFLIDESTDFPQIERWSQWVDRNPGPGNRLPTMATVAAPSAWKHAPSLDIPTSTLTVGDTATWQQAVEHYHRDPGRRLFMYNGYRPSSGCLVTEDDGVALRELAWGQYKMHIERWFVWESTYYDNYQGGQGETNVFRKAQTFGGSGQRDSVLGETGWNYNNGDGVLFYPGTDTTFPDDSYQIPGPIASLRLKHWRRGIQDVDYLALAAIVDRKRVEQIVARLVPRILWENGIDDPHDPTWVRTDISWPTDPDRWEAARAELAEIIHQHSAESVR